MIVGFPKTERGRPARVRAGDPRSDLATRPCGPIFHLLALHRSACSSMRIERGPASPFTSWFDPAALIGVARWTDGTPILIRSSDHGCGAIGSALFSERDSQKSRISAGFIPVSLQILCRKQGEQENGAGFRRLSRRGAGRNAVGNGQKCPTRCFNLAVQGRA